MIFHGVSLAGGGGGHEATIQVISLQSHKRSLLHSAEHLYYSTWMCANPCAIGEDLHLCMPTGSCKQWRQEYVPWCRWLRQIHKSLFTQTRGNWRPLKLQSTCKHSLCCLALSSTVPRATAALVSYVGGDWSTWQTGAHRRKEPGLFLY